MCFWWWRQRPFQGVQKYGRRTNEYQLNYREDLYQAPQIIKNPYNNFKDEKKVLFIHKNIGKKTKIWKTLQILAKNPYSKILLNNFIAI